MTCVVNTKSFRICSKFNLVFFLMSALVTSKDQLKCSVSKVFFFQKMLTVSWFYKHDSTVTFFPVLFCSSCWYFGMTSLYFFSIGSGSLLRNVTISLRKYRLHHISSSCTQTIPGIRRADHGLIQIPDIQILWHLDCLYEKQKCEEELWIF